MLKSIFIFRTLTPNKRDMMLPKKIIPTSLKLVPFASFGGLMYFSFCMEDLGCQKAWDSLGEDLRALVYNTYSTVKSLAHDTIFFIGQSIEDVQKYFTESNGRWHFFSLHYLHFTNVEKLEFTGHCGMRDKGSMFLYAVFKNLIFLCSF